MTTVRTLLAPDLPAAVAAEVGEVVDGSVVVEAVPHVSGSPATASLERVSGRTVGGRRWSLVVKVLQHVRHWPGLAHLPPDLAASFAAEFPWRDELRLWDPRIQSSLPPGLRSPRLVALVDLPDDRVAVWTEDVPHVDIVWDTARYARAAYLLGRWNARSTSPEVLAVSSLPPGYGLRMHAERAVPTRGLAPLADDLPWAHPWLAPHHDLRRRLLDLGDRIPAMLAQLDALPQCLPHGDACPQNLLPAGSGPNATCDLVAIDLSFGSPHAVGFDLAQLCVGLIQAGDVPAGQFPDIAAAVVPAYRAGAAAEGLNLRLDQVRTGFAWSVLLRSGFDSIPYALLNRPRDDDSAAAILAERVALTRHLVSLVDSL